MKNVWLPVRNMDSHSLESSYVATMRYDISVVVESHDFPSFSLSLMHEVSLYICGLISQSTLSVTEVYDHASVYPGTGVSSISKRIWVS